MDEAIISAAATDTTTTINTSSSIAVTDVPSGTPTTGSTGRDAVDTTTTSNTNTNTSGHVRSNGMVRTIGSSSTHPPSVELNIPSDTKASNGLSFTSLQQELEEQQQHQERCPPPI
jgi:hypothetical protein